MGKYSALAKELNIWMSLGGFQEKSPEEKKVYSMALLHYLN